MKSKKTPQVFQGLSINSGSVLSAACLYSADRHKAVVEYSLKNKKEVNAKYDVVSWIT